MSQNLQIESIFDPEYTDGLDKESAFATLKHFMNNEEEFTWCDSQLEYVDVNSMLTLLAKSFDKMMCAPISDNKTTPVQPLERHFHFLLLKITRKRICPHTKKFSLVKAWDNQFYNVLIDAVLRNNQRASWNRLIRGLIQADLSSTPNFDGSKGIVNTIANHISDLINAVQSDNIPLLKEIITNCNDLQNWFQPRCIAMASAFNGWSLLHFAASAPQISKEMCAFLVQQVGCDILEVDNNGQTALHIAACCLNHSAVQYFSTESPLANRAVDHTGRIPLDALLHTIPLCKWNKRITSVQLQQMFRALIPVNNPEVIWNISASASSSASSNTTEISSNSPCSTDLHMLRSSRFYRSVVLSARLSSNLDEDH